MLSTNYWGVYFFIFFIFLFLFFYFYFFIFFFLSFIHFFSSSFFSTGDLSYGDCVGRLWDVYGEMIESVSSKIPWMVGPGNHEIEQIFVSDVDSDGESN